MMRNRLFAFVLFMAIGFIFGGSPAAMAAGADPEYKTSGGLTVYIGTMPAQIIQSHPSGHPEGAPQRRHEYHLVVAIFDAASGTRISDAAVTARVSGHDLAGFQQNKLEPMSIANTISYGGLFDLLEDLYTIRLTIQRPGSRQPVILDFAYDHRRYLPEQRETRAGQLPEQASSRAHFELALDRAAN